MFISKLSASQAGKKSLFKTQVIGKLTEMKNKIATQKNSKFLSYLFDNRFSIILPYFFSKLDIEINPCS
jgi:hypothetical protein